MYNDRLTKRGGLPIPKRQIGRASKRAMVEDEPLPKRILISSLWGLLANGISGIALVSIVCLVAYSSSDPLSMIPAISLLALLPSNFLGGFVSAKRCGTSKTACGLTTAAMWCAVSLLGSLCLYAISPSGYSMWQILLLHAASILFSILGALAGGIKRAPSRRKRRFR